LVRYLIDTSSIGRAIADDTWRLRRAISNLGIDQIGTSVMTVMEIEYGLARRRVRHSKIIRDLLRLFNPVAFDERDAATAGSLRAQMEGGGKPIGLMDTLIAAQALTRGLTLISHDTDDFARVPRLRILEI
jgi:tRNA(fMet)-specific endonuclease VapC